MLIHEKWTCVESSSHIKVDVGIFSSPEPEAQVSFSDQNLSVVRRRCSHCRCRRRCCKLFTFSSSSPEPLGLFQPNLAQSILVQGEIITKLEKYIDEIKKSFSKTTGPISFKLGTMNPWVKGIQVCLNEWPHPFPRGDNSEIAKITLTKCILGWGGFKFVKMKNHSILINK